MGFPQKRTRASLKQSSKQQQRAFRCSAQPDGHTLLQLSSCLLQGTTDMKTDRAIRSGLTALNPPPGLTLAASPQLPLPPQHAVPSFPPAAAAGPGRDEPRGMKVLVTGLCPYSLQVAGISRTSPCAQLSYFHTTYLLLAEIYFQVLIYAQGIQRFQRLSHATRLGDRSSVPAAVGASAPSSPSQQTPGWCWGPSLLSESLAGLLPPTPLFTAGSCPTPVTQPSTR